MSVASRIFIFFVFLFSISCAEGDQAFDSPPKMDYVKQGNIKPIYEQHNKDAFLRIQSITLDSASDFEATRFSRSLYRGDELIAHDIGGNIYIAPNKDKAVWQDLYVVEAYSVLNRKKYLVVKDCKIELADILWQEKTAILVFSDGKKLSFSF